MRTCEDSKCSKRTEIDLKQVASYPLEIRFFIQCGHLRPNANFAKEKDSEASNVIKVNGFSTITSFLDRD